MKNIVFIAAGLVLWKAEQEKRAVNKAIVYEENSFEGLEAVEAKAG